MKIQSVIVFTLRLDFLLNFFALLRVSQEVNLEHCNSYIWSMTSIHHCSHNANNSSSYGKNNTSKAFLLLESFCFKPTCLLGWRKLFWQYFQISALNYVQRENVLRRWFERRNSQQPINLHLTDPNSSKN